ncbi:MAG: hypothetical protein ACRDHW_05590 [Ktedonobacteraceae bacterium]
MQEEAIERSAYETNAASSEVDAPPVRNWLWRVSWREGIYRPMLCFEASTAEEAVRLFQAWLLIHALSLPAGVHFEVHVLPTSRHRN